MVLLPGEDRSAGVARGFARDAIRCWRLGESVDLGDVLLVVSELVTNAVRHRPAHASAFQIGLRIGHVPGVLAFSIEDPHPGKPVPGRPSLSRTSGRGLHLVAAHCDEWHVLPTGDGGKQVCAFWELPQGSGAATRRLRGDFVPIAG
ncbi:ATP-binding protein [Kitasatospora aureofaciens]|uniref:ATP-binding protein n=1 Tax=Kitasatospora aureofaciens TaxID=1894 RepID=UPI00131B2D7F|nr:ATP-binding protein [Kitasatospora aureofaciens]